MISMCPDNLRSSTISFHQGLWPLFINPLKPSQGFQAHFRKAINTIPFVSFCICVRAYQQWVNKVHARNTMKYNEIHTMLTVWPLEIWHWKTEAWRWSCVHFGAGVLGHSTYGSHYHCCEATVGGNLQFPWAPLWYTRDCTSVSYSLNNIIDW